VEGLCAAGGPPLIDDSIACTDDSCSDVENGAVHTPRNERCGTGPVWCLLETERTTVLECVPGVGCRDNGRFVERTCPSRPTTCDAFGTDSYMLTRHQPTCSVLGTGCAAPAPLAEVCSPSPATCISSTVLRNWRATCSASGNGACSAEEKDRVDCSRANAKTCSADGTSVVTIEGSCSGGTPARCTTSTSMSPCTAPGQRCQQGRLTTYAPGRCSGGVCNPQVPTTTTCPVPPSRCETSGGTIRYRTFTPDCDNQGSGCRNEGSATVTECGSDAETSTCQNDTQVRSARSCTTSSGCGTSTIRQNCGVPYCQDNATVCGGCDAAGTSCASCRACPSSQSCGVNGNTGRAECYPLPLR
jgi:hypothetical protein